VILLTSPHTVLELASGEREVETDTSLLDQSDHDEPEESEFNEEVELLSEIEACITRLFRVSSLIRQAAPTDLFAKALTKSRLQFNDSFDIAHVFEKYPKLMADDRLWLRKRLGRAITKRRQYLSYVQHHHDKLSGAQNEPAEPAEPAPMKPEILEALPMKQLQAFKSPLMDSASRPSTYITKATTLAPDRITPQMLVADDSDPEDDARSYTTISRSIDGDYDTSALTKIPKLTDLRVGKEKAIECPFCFRMQRFRSEKAWKRHVFADLRSYVCTFPDCDAQLFGDINEWFRHEMQTHRVEYHCRFCNDNVFNKKDKFLRHVRNAHVAILDDADEESLLDISRKPVENIPAEDCPCCDDLASRLRVRETPDDWSSNTGADKVIMSVTLTKFKRHLAAHMEQLSLFAASNARVASSDDNVDSNDAIDEANSELSERSNISSLAFRSPVHSIGSSSGQDDAVTAQSVDAEPVLVNTRSQSTDPRNVELLHDHNGTSNLANHQRARFVESWDLFACGVCKAYLKIDRTCDCGSGGPADIIGTSVPAGKEVLITGIARMEPLAYSGYLADQILEPKQPHPVHFSARLVSGLDGYSIAPPLPPPTDLPAEWFDQAQHLVAIRDNKISPYSPGRFLVLKPGEILIALGSIEFMSHSYYCGYHERDATVGAGMPPYDFKYFDADHAVLRVYGEPELRGQWDNGSSLNFVVGSKSQMSLPLDNLHLRLARLQERYDCALSINNTSDFEVYAKVRGPRRFEFLENFRRDEPWLFDEDFKPFWGRVLEPCVNYIDDFAQLSPDTRIWIRDYDDVNRFFGIELDSKKPVSVLAKAIRREDGAEPIERSLLNEVHPLPDTDTSKQITMEQSTSAPMGDTINDAKTLQKARLNTFHRSALLEAARSRGSAIADRLKHHSIDHKMFRNGGITVPMDRSRRSLADVVEKIVLRSVDLSFHVQGVWMDTRCQITTTVDEPDRKFLAVYNIAMIGLDQEDMFINFPEGIVNFDRSVPAVISGGYRTENNLFPEGTKESHTCHICGRAFLRRSNIESHVERHTEGFLEQPRYGNVLEKNCVMSHVGILVHLTFDKIAFSLVATKRSFARWKYRTKENPHQTRHGRLQSETQESSTSREGIIANFGPDDRPMRTQIQKEEDQKVLLTNALKMANTAVARDHEGDSLSAIEEYKSACVLLQQVIIRGVIPEDRKRLLKIWTSYVARIDEREVQTQCDSDSPDTGDDWPGYPAPRPGQGPPNRPSTRWSRIPDQAGPEVYAPSMVSDPHFNPFQLGTPPAPNQLVPLGSPANPYGYNQNPFALVSPNSFASSALKSADDTHLTIIKHRPKLVSHPKKEEECTDPDCSTCAPSASPSELSPRINRRQPAPYVHSSVLGQLQRAHQLSSSARRRPMSYYEDEGQEEPVPGMLKYNSSARSPKHLSTTQQFEKSKEETKSAWGPSWTTSKNKESSKQKEGEEEDRFHRELGYDADPDPW
jgi:hypothetical protein